MGSPNRRENQPSEEACLSSVRRMNPRRRLFLSTYLDQGGSKLAENSAKRRTLSDRVHGGRIGASRAGDGAPRGPKQHHAPAPGREPNSIGGHGASRKLRSVAAGQRAFQRRVHRDG